MFLLAVVASPVSTAHAGERAQLGTHCTTRTASDAVEARLTPAAGVRPQDIAEAAAPIAIGSFTAMGTEYALRCKGSGPSLACSALASGRDPASVCTAEVSATTTKLRLSAANTDVLALVPSTALGYTTAMDFKISDL